jgi:hypothetical protein
MMRAAQAKCCHELLVGAAPKLSCQYRTADRTQQQQLAGNKHVDGMVWHRAHLRQRV